MDFGDERGPEKDRTMERLGKLRQFFQMAHDSAGSNVTPGKTMPRESWIPQPYLGPTADDVAREVMLALIKAGSLAGDWESFAKTAYAAADALVAERERRAK